MITKPTFALGLALSAAACSSPSTEDLTVDATIQDANLTVKQAPGGLATTSVGSFLLVLKLGQLAASTTDVGWQAGFALQRSSDRKVLVAKLPALSSAQSTSVGIGSTVKVAFSLDEAVSLGEAAAKSEICTAGPVIISGLVTDSAQGKSVPVESAAFTPSCP
ncbi:MAG: hypothetical protein IT374_10180 [Polyangiaceae bacterium]|nr:hypothetical protein [Polyangiaceae bacterium]